MEKRQKTQQHAYIQRVQKKNKRSKKESLKLKNHRSSDLSPAATASAAPRAVGDDEADDDRRRGRTDISTAFASSAAAPRRPLSGERTDIDSSTGDPLRL